ncbi:MAG: DegT/DnrJ/EryC1/StrS family aminotransferase [Betaproteobacteria bacterium]
METFAKSFTQQEPIPEQAIERAVAVMRSGRLHRYNTVSGEIAEAALFEREFARYIDVPYCLAVASGGYALHIALRSAGLAPGAPVLCNGYTLSPVPGAIHNAGGRTVLVETGEDLTIDLADLEAAADESGARMLLLSHMRGHIGDMDALMTICQRRGITVIEDCAHTMGARWRGQPSGTFGLVACFSTQTYKHLNSGEGGLLVTGDAEVMRRAILHSGSYMFYDRHPCAPPPESFEATRFDTPNYSGRMDNLRAAILRPQLAGLDQNCRRWNRLYAVLDAGLRGTAGVSMPVRAAHEDFVGSSIQFRLPGFSAGRIRAFIAACAARGVPVKWFGAEQPDGYTSRFDSWHYLGAQRPLPRTQLLLSTLCDVRIPLTFDEDDCRTIAAMVGVAIGDCENSR